MKTLFMVFSDNSAKNYLRFRVDLNLELMAARWNIAGSGCGQRRQKSTDPGIYGAESYK